VFRFCAWELQPASKQNRGNMTAIVFTKYSLFSLIFSVVKDSVTHWSRSDQTGINE